ncbi:MAG: MORN variant repeat protein [candidate division WWE3 bacterium GW2011_GWC2_44_9]|uniref:MORN variant repeat protein n=1 Tax=candidate division WWE3 bacterium GW2011_GWC2_44_9 TaxID=1619125 RepID=A0A0G1MW94_UNCKA|nr:MAG: MORN variant repeat protein [candidate division WWE3 bacterium GW2011_GWC2_44_9]OGW69243.1 MAG: hypothetical protein A2036_03865 [Omnitrophica bacterium GWA2_50_21]
MSVIRPQTSDLLGKTWLEGQLRYIPGPNGTGDAVGYYKNGKIRFRYPVKGNDIHGTGKMWYENGILECEEQYCHGVLNGVSCYWYLDGKIKSEKHYRHGIFHGPQKEWHPNGSIKFQGSFTEDRRHGLFTNWYANGNVASQISFVDGRRNGISKQYTEGGALILEELYVRAVLIPTRIQKLLLSGQMMAQDILKIRNAAVRRICLEQFGYARFLAQMKGETIDKSGEQELLKVEWHHREEPIYLVKVRCPSTGCFYTLRVPPSTKTVRQGIAWTFGLKEREYSPLAET